MRFPSIFAPLVLALFTVSVAQAEDPPKKAERVRIAVLDFRTEGRVDATGSKSAANSVRDEVDTSRFDLIDRDMMKERMDEKDFASMAECDQVKCLVKYGKSLDAQKIVGGYLSSFGDGWQVTLRLVDVNTGSQERTFAREFQGTQFELLKLTREGAREMLGDGTNVGGAKESSGTKSKPGDKSLALDLGSGVKLELVLIPAGEFLMGSPDLEADRLSQEGPQHRVKISKPFYMGKYEVTQAQWQAVMGSNPSSFKGDSNLPVESVSWEDCQEFCRKLSQKTGQPIRLPTEAEWEYACRAGTTTPFSFGNTIATSQANYDGRASYGSGSKGEYRERTTRVGSFAPNAWGLFDMHGNVWEWCQDCYGSYPLGTVTDPSGDSARSPFRVLRGGSWLNHPRHCRSAYCHCYSSSGRGNNFGIRVASGTP